MTTPPQPDTIWRLRTELYPSFALLAAIQLDVFTPLSDGPGNVEQVAEAIGAEAEDRPARLRWPLRPFLRQHQ